MTSTNNLAADQQTRVLRMLDAAANRASEGLRVIEDYARFALDDRHLTAELKKIRHRLATTVAALSRDEVRLAARDTQRDVGCEVRVASQEAPRADLRELVAANFARLGQALRSLEETSKLLDIAVASDFESLRYEIYTLEVALRTTGASAERLADVRLYVLFDTASAEQHGARDLATFAETILQAGADAIQLRDKRLDDRTLLACARQLRSVTERHKKLLFVNDRPDIAAISRADGVHLGQDDLEVHQARTIVGPEAIIGVSTHNLEQARQAVLDGANYLGVGPTFASQTKTFAETELQGLDFLRQVAAEIRLPTFAIGGITSQRLAEVRATGIERIAVGEAITAAQGDPAEATRELARELTQATATTTG